MAKQIAKKLNGNHTEIFIQTYADRVLILITQLGKVGNLVSPLLPPAQDLSTPDALSLPVPSPAIHLTPLLGSAPSEDMQTLHSLYAAQVATIIWTDQLNRSGDDSRRSVVVGLALAKLDDHEKRREVFQAIMSMLLDVLDGGEN
ncbi:hypothetical protein BJ165DRAFT_1443618 [Panaeolus papilionaceus]|nr:hypothetical protein BJ165DRAFT_1443618 [Panaeolus papilionaceus]